LILPCPLAKLFNRLPNAPVEGDKLTKLLALVLVALDIPVPLEIGFIPSPIVEPDLLDWLELEAGVGCKKAVLAPVVELTGVSRVVVPSAFDITQLL